MLRIVVIMLLLISSAADVKSGASTSSSSEITLNWGDSILIAPYEITAAGFSEGTVEEKKDKCSSAKDYEKRLFGCLDYVLLKVTKGDKHVLDVVLSDHNITVEGAELTNTSIFEDEDFILTLFARKVVTGYNIPSPYVELTITLKQKEKKQEEVDKVPASLLKTVPEWAYRSYDEDKSACISLEVENLANTYIQGILRDSVPDCFAVAKELKWAINLKPQEKWHTSYLIKQVNCTEDVHTFPQAVLEITYQGKLYNISSSNSAIKLYGSRIVMDKSVRGRDGEYSVDVNIKNEGNRASRVMVKDVVPEGAEMVSGVLNFTIVLQPGMEYTNSYNVTGNIVALPGAVAEFYDYNPSTGRFFRSGSVSSQESNISETQDIPEANSKPASTVLPTSTPESQHQSGILNKIIDFFKLIIGKISP
ncbi:uncharacterized protein ig2599ANME_1776 [groundwater metagenome]